ncbi:MAG: RNA polymerase factor sigma-54 [Prevotellaceae bacterium]|jgi:RNA polymerase sigma-54 factor|nr:RNA polymerase factor sigma-54 [Prevotellaceae bacterium]
MLKQSLQQRLQQKLAPQQIQLVKLLEVPTMELEERIRQELEENPALEEGADESLATDETEQYDEGSNDEIDLEEYMADDDIPDYKLHTNNHSADDKRETIPFSVGITFHEHLENQLGLCSLSEHDRAVAEYIIGNIDDEGYLRREITAMVDDIAFQTGMEVSEAQMLDLLQIVQDFEPAGVGARSLQECLLLQIRRKKKTDAVLLAEKIIEHHFDEFSKRHYEKIIKRLNLSDEQFRQATEEITRLNPKPGNAWETLLERNAEQIIPDFILEIENGEPCVKLNSGNVPELRVSSAYKEMFQDYSQNKQNNKEMKNAVLFVKQKLDAAKWFIDAIRQRCQTLLTTMTAIVQLQREFFIEGDETLLRPMILKDVAEATGLDISTISRVSNSKYIQTDFGVFPVKYFFSESMQTDSGEEVSSREIKSILQTCINDEDKRKPLPDEVLAEILKEKGYVIARRTVAKDREQMNIPVARLRKKI